MICIHGFLGKGSDWTSVLPVETQFIALNLFNTKKESAFDYFGKDFQLSALSQFVADQARTLNQKPIVVGYSLGGRVALQTLVSHPQAFRAAILISTHPGLEGETEKTARIQSDEHWARRFEQDAWKTVVGDWNQQPVLRGTVPLFVPAATAEENRFSRNALAAALRQASLGVQPDFRPQLKNISIPVLIVAGERDQKFTHLAQEMHSLLKGSTQVILPHAGHRAPWDQPQEFRAALERFLSALES